MDENKPFFLLICGFWKIKTFPTFWVFHLTIYSYVPCVCKLCICKHDCVFPLARCAACGGVDDDNIIRKRRKVDITKPWAFWITVSTNEKETSGFLDNGKTVSR